MIITKIFEKSRLALMAALVAGTLMYSCKDDKEDTCTLALDATCFCEKNATDAACITLNACEVTSKDAAFIAGALTGNEVMGLIEGAAIGAFYKRLRVDGADAAFKVYNSEDMKDANWGAMIGKGADLTGTAEVAIDGSDCGLGNEGFALVNTGKKAMMDINVNIETGAYTYAFNDASPCFDLDKKGGQLSLYLKGNVNNGETNDSWGNIGAPFVQDPINPDVWTIDVVYADYATDLNSKPVFNKTGDWGDGVGDGNIAADYGLLPAEGTKNPTEGILLMKAFSSDLSSGTKKEILYDCSTAVGGNTGMFYHEFPKGGDIATFGQPVTKITINTRLLTYKVDFSYPEAE